MTRYYTELQDKKVKYVIVQDDTGVYLSPKPRRGRLPLACLRLPKMGWIKLPEWDKEREVSTVDRDTLDFIRRCERGSYMTTTPTDIREMLGSVEEVIRAVFKRGF